MLSVILSLVITVLLSPSCEKDPVVISPKPTPVIEEYKACCGVEPVAGIVFDTGYYYIPNVFTPNGDSINDVFRPYYGGEIRLFQWIFITNLEKDSTFFYFDGTLLQGHEKENWGWDGEVQTDTGVHIHKGAFRYNLEFRSLKGNLHYVEGVACSIICDEDAKIFKDKAGCFYPQQVGEDFRLDKSIVVTEEGCF